MTRCFQKQINRVKLPATKAMNTRELGELGEKLACEYLVKKGHKILGKNDRISFGEIDIIARKKRKFFARFDKTIHFIEVKTLKAFPSQTVFPEEHVNYKKQRKLRQLAQIWLEKNNGNKINCGEVGYNSAPKIIVATMLTEYVSKMSAAMPAQSPTLSPTKSAITPGFLGSSSGIFFSILPTMSVPTSAALV
jgi:putative endonuclease